MRHGSPCPKCESTNIVLVPGEYVGQMHRENLFGSGRPHSIQIGLLRRAVISHFVCADCGFLEQWIEDAKDLAKVEDEFTTRRRKKSPSKR